MQANCEFPGLSLVIASLKIEPNLEATVFLPMALHWRGWQRRKAVCCMQANCEFPGLSLVIASLTNEPNKQQIWCHSAAQMRQQKFQSRYVFCSA